MVVAALLLARPRASRCRCGRCTPGCHRRTPSRPPPARCCWPRSCSRWAPTAWSGSPSRRCPTGSPPWRPCSPSPASSGSSGEASPAWSSATSSGWSPTPRWRTWASSRSAWPPARRPGCRRRSSPTSPTASSSALLFFLVGGLKEPLGVGRPRTSPGRPCARCPRGWASRWWSASPPPSGCPAWSASGASSSPCYAAWSPAPDRPARRCSASARCSAVARHRRSPRRTRCGCPHRLGRESSDRAAACRRRPRWRRWRRWPWPVARRRSSSRSACCPGRCCGPPSPTPPPITRPGSVTPVSAAVVSIDCGILLPALAPAAGRRVLVLVVDLVDPACAACHYALAWLSLLVGSPSRPSPGWAPAGRRALDVLPAGQPGPVPLRRRRRSPAGLQQADALGSPPARGCRLGRCCSRLAWPTRRRARPAARRDRSSLRAHRDRPAPPPSPRPATSAPGWSPSSWPRCRSSRWSRCAGPASAVAGAVAAARPPRWSRSPCSRWRPPSGSPRPARPFFDAGRRAATARRRPGRPRARSCVARRVRRWPWPACGFKLSLVPFHAWTPEAYDGASAAGRGVPRRRPPRSRRWPRCSWCVQAVAAARGARRSPPSPCWPSLSMTLGNVMALRQDDVVRLLAWSTVAQAGWVILPLAAVSTLGGPGLRAATCSPTSSPPSLAFAVVAADRSCAAPARPAPSSAYGSGAGCCASTRCWPAALAPGPASLAGLPPGVLGARRQGGGAAPGGRRGLWVLGRGRRGQRRARRRGLPALAAGAARQPAAGGGRRRPAERRPRHAGARRRVHAGSDARRAHLRRRSASPALVLDHGSAAPELLARACSAEAAHGRQPGNARRTACTRR